MIVGPEGRSEEKKSPVTGGLLGRFPSTGHEEVERAVASARRAQGPWAALPASGRAQVLRRARQLLVREADRIAQLVTLETGKPFIESLFEVAGALGAFEYVEKNGPRLLAPRTFRLGTPNFALKSNACCYYPHGVCALIMPWNFPLAIPAGELAQALVGGNAVVFKPSELSPFTGLALGELFLEAGLPPGLLNVVTGDGRTGASLVAAQIDKVSFTGSFETGTRLMASCAARGIPLTAELGGKDPAIVLEDADLDSASRGIVWAAMMNCGQACASAERIYVAKPLHDEFVQRLASLASALKVGNGMDSSVEVGPLIVERQFEKVRSHVDDALARGARAATGGKPLPELGPLFFAPTVLAGVDQSMAVMREETFGPVAPVMSFDTAEEAAGLANDSPYALGASIWTRDAVRGQALAGRLRAGMVWINDALFSHAAPETPWGGPGQSGNSRTHGPWGILNYVRMQYVSTDRYTSTLKDGWYPYGPDRIGYTKAALDLLFRSGFSRKLGALPTLLRGFVRSCPGGMPRP
jgi:succinate-semialdehyde dehydrogenase/glutarate-semialdehyde dehydrogenase